jgi:hypothetical protein
MAVDETEEWEMEEEDSLGGNPLGGGNGSGGSSKSASANGSGTPIGSGASIKESIAEADSPTTAVSGMNSQIDLVNTLDKDGRAAWVS